MLLRRGASAGQYVHKTTKGGAGGRGRSECSRRGQSPSTTPFCSASSRVGSPIHQLNYRDSRNATNPFNQIGLLVKSVVVNSSDVSYLLCGASEEKQALRFAQDDKLFEGGDLVGRIRRWHDEIRYIGGRVDFRMTELDSRLKSTENVRSSHKGFRSRLEISESGVRVSGID